MAASSPTASPSIALWRALGCPSSTTKATPLNEQAPCAGCGGPGGRFLIKAVVSDKFTGWDPYTGDNGVTGDPAWCDGCTWAHTAVELRVRPWLITVDGQFGQPSREALHDMLSRPLPAHTALSVPVSRKKHLVPYLRWGEVRGDDRSLPWSPTHAGRFRLVLWMRALGFSEAALTAPAPRFEQLVALTPKQMAEVMRAWEELNAWRADTAYLDVALTASRATAHPSPVNDSSPRQGSGA